MKIDEMSSVEWIGANDRSGSWASAQKKQLVSPEEVEIYKLIMELNSSDCQV